MSDYRRFIAYLYEYPNQRKGTCCGFVRVESQNGFCRMDFQIKSASLVPETSVTVYGFIRKNGRMYGIPLGNLRSGRTSTSGKLFLQSDSLNETDITLENLGGLLLLHQKNHVIATQWDDLPIQPEFFSPTLPANPELLSDTAETTDSSKAVNPVSSHNLSPDASLPTVQSTPSPAASATSAASATFAVSVPSSGSATSDASPDSDASSVPLSFSTASDSSAPAYPQEPHQESTSGTQAPPALHMTSADPSCSAAPQATDRAACYLQFQDQFPEFHPFPDDDMTDCLRLAITDLPSLRAAGLFVASDRFVRHGAGSYHHLLLARSRDQQEIWYFGVPGVYTPNEQFMASLFGFFHFKQAMRPAELAPEERFGYWYRSL